MMDEKFTYDEFIKLIHVPRETHNCLENFVSLLKKWQKKINLISDKTFSDVWMRHVIDSAQLFKYLKESDRVADLGSGGGFPGIVLAILGIKKVTLVESDIRKTAFLREASRIAKINVEIVSKRVEDFSFDNMDVITARGFSSIKNILDIIGSKISPSQRILLLKGKGCDEEIKEAKNTWDFDYKNVPSITDTNGVVTTITNVIKRS